MHADGGWSERVIGREHQSAPVLSVFVGGFRWSGEYIVPFENVALGRMSDDIGRRILRDGFVFLSETFGGS